MSHPFISDLIRQNEADKLKEKLTEKRDEKKHALRNFSNFPEILSKHFAT